MYRASERFNEIILGNSRQFKTKIKAGEKEISTGFRSVRRYAQSSDTGYVSIGGAVSSYIEVEMWKPEIMLENAEIEVSIGLLVDGEPEYVPLGLYTVLKPQNDDGVVRFTAYDRIQSKMSGAYFSELSYPADGKDLLREISTKTGVSIDVSNLPDGVKIANRAVISETGVDENGDVTTNTTYEAPFNGYTYREALGYIAQLYGKFATADRTGAIVFRWYEETEYEINPNRYYDDLVTAESVFKVEAITCQAGEQSLKAGAGIENIQIENPVMTQERLDAVYELVKDLEFLPASLSFFGDMRLDLGDIVTVNDKRGNVVKVPVMNVSQDFDGGLLTRIQSYSAIGQDESVKGPTVQRLDRMYTELFLVKEIIGQKASFDYIHAIDADFQNVRADYGEYKELVAGKFTATDAIIGRLSAKQANFEQTTTERLSAQDAKIENLEANQITTDYLEANYATVERLNAANAEIATLKANQITTDYLEANFAQVDLANIKDGCITTAMIGTGVVQSAQIADGAITNLKVAGDLDATKITAGTLSVDRLIIRGSEKSLVYELNNITGALQAQNVDTLNGEILTLRTITADKIVANSITGNEIAAKTISANNIVANSITSAELAAGAVKAGNIEAGAVTAEKLAAGSILVGKLDESLKNMINGAAAKVEVQYATSASPTAPPAGGWSTTAPEWMSGQYMWQKTVTTHSDGSVEEAVVTCLSGAIGQTGAPGSPGKDGAPGAKGKGVKSIVPQYYLSASASMPTSGSWSDKDPGWTSGKYIWTRSHVTYDDGSTEDTAEVLANTLNGANSTAASAQSTANTASSTATAAKSTADAVDKVITDWCYSNNRTYINGGKIYTGTVTANQIASNAVTAEKINAGAVTTAKLATDAIKSKNYAYTSGNFSTAGTFLDLLNGVIRSKNFGIDASGNAEFKGKLVGATGSFSGSVAASSFSLNGTNLYIEQKTVDFLIGISSSAGSAASRFQGNAFVVKNANAMYLETGLYAAKASITDLGFDGIEGDTVRAKSIYPTGITASRVLISDSNRKVAASDITTTQLGYLSGVTSNIQTQLNSKVTAGNKIAAGANAWIETNSEGGDLYLVANTGHRWEIDALNGVLRFISYGTAAAPKTTVPLTITQDGVVNQIGALSSLSTSAKGNIVSAVNELNTKSIKQLTSPWATSVTFTMHSTHAIVLVNEACIVLVWNNSNSVLHKRIPDTSLADLTLSSSGTSTARSITIKGSTARSFSVWTL